MGDERAPFNKIDDRVLYRWLAIIAVVAIVATAAVVVIPKLLQGGEVAADAAKKLPAAAKEAINPVSQQDKESIAAAYATTFPDGALADLSSVEFKRDTATSGQNAGTIWIKCNVDGQDMVVEAFHANGSWGFSRMPLSEYVNYGADPTRPEF